MWTQAEAIELCKEVEAIAPHFGCHVALTGGCLYKDGPRKDLDLLFYRIRQADSINKVALLDALAKLGIYCKHDFGFVVKGSVGKNYIDLLFPEEDNGDYNNDAVQSIMAA